MFKILGADGKEYGPVTVDQIKQWIKDGRANHETMAEKMGEIGWKPLAQYPDFLDLFPAQPPALPTTPAAAAPVAAASVQAPDARARALQLVNGPAIALLVTAILNIALFGFGAIFQGHGRPYVPPMYAMNPDAMRLIQEFSGTAGFTLRLIGIAVGVLIIVGALKMQKLRGRGLATTAAILAMIPCSPCCVLGLPFGIWALVVLSKPEVQSQFDH